MSTNNNLQKTIAARADDITAQWQELQAPLQQRMSPAEQKDTEQKSRQFMEALNTAMRDGGVGDLSGSHWAPVKEILTDLSVNRAKAGYTPSDTATFVFSLKQPLFTNLQKELSGNVAALSDAIWQATELLDRLGLLTFEVFQKTREDVISRQQQELLELSTPVVRLWENVLALPLIGTLDSARTQVVMQNLLESIVQTRSDFAIIDITGVPVVDTLVAQHLLKTVAAARLMGADCLISGIRPQIAQTIIHLGVDLTNVTTKATLADAFAVALKRSGQVVVREEKQKIEVAK